MTVARAQLVDVEVTPWYHVISKTVRGAFLLAEGAEDRKLWLEKRLEELSGCFAVEVAGFAVLDNHLHVLVRLCPERSASWSDEEVVRRWGRLFPPRGKDRKPVAVSEAFARRKISASRARSGPVCWRVFRWAVTCCWWTGRAGWSAGGRRA